MIFDDIELWGEVAEFAVNPPIIVLEVFDQDTGVSALGEGKGDKSNTLIFYKKLV